MCTRKVKQLQFPVRTTSDMQISAEILQRAALQVSLKNRVETLIDLVKSQLEMAFASNAGRLPVDISETALFPSLLIEITGMAGKKFDKEIVKLCKQQLNRLEAQFGFALRHDAARTRHFDGEEHLVFSLQFSELDKALETALNISLSPCIEVEVVKGTSQFLIGSRGFEKLALQQLHCAQAVFDAFWTDRAPLLLLTQ